MSDYQQQSFGEQPIHDPQRAFPPPQPSSAGSPRRRSRAVLLGYQVRGGEDGPVINTLTVTGDTSSVDEEESVSTKNNSTKLTVSATDVSGR